MSTTPTNKPANGTPWRPGCGTDEVAFETAICGRCANYKQSEHCPNDPTALTCPSLENSFFELAPTPEWVWQDGSPHCLNFAATGGPA